MTSYELYEKLSQKYSKELSCSWDNDGIAVSGGPVCLVEKVLVALDVTEKVLLYAAENGFDTVISHHPMLFSPLKSLTPDTNVGRKAIFALLNNITVMSFHTRLDAAAGGVNDALCEILDLHDVKSFGNSECPTMGRIGKISPMSISELFNKVKSSLSCNSLCYTDDTDEICETVAVLGGAGKDFIYDAIDAGADVFITGEASYNALLDASESGITIITAGHFETECPVCEKIAQTVKKIAPSVIVQIYNGINNFIK